MIVLGIDPGLAECGFALIDWKPDAVKLLVSGTIRTEPGDEVHRRTAEIDLRLSQAISPFGNPERIAIEYPGAAFGGKAYKGVLENFYVCGFLCGIFRATHTPNPSDWTKGFKGYMKQRMEAASNQAVAVLGHKGRTSQHQREAMAIALWAATQ